MIRVLQESDAEVYRVARLNALQKSSEAFGSTYDREAQLSLETFAQRIRPTEDKFVLGAFRGERDLVGIVTFVRESGHKTSHKGNVYGMYVEPFARGQGVGLALLEDLILRAKSLPGLEQIHLMVVADNVAAKRLYTSLGFEVYGVEPHALKLDGKYSDEELMVLFLGSH